MKRWLNILVFIVFSVSAFAQVDTRVVDSLQEVLATQEGREKVKTMLELTWDFYDVSFDDCIDWGEKAVEEANKLGFADLQAKANYVLGIQYAYHADLDLAESYLHKAYSQYITLGDTANAFESLWFIATYEMTLGSVDTAYKVYEQALPLAEQLGDTSAYAYVLSNMGLIEYKKGSFEKAFQHYDQAKRLFDYLGDEPVSLNVQFNMATICFERGRSFEAREMLWEVMPKIELYQDYYTFAIACLSMGRIYENEIINFDSAMYYLEQAISYAELTLEENDDKSEIFTNNVKAEALVEIANVSYNKEEYELALDKYKEALNYADEVSCSKAQMTACLGMGTLYAHFGKAKQSLSYINRFFELESKTGNSAMHTKARLFLVLDYARLGMYEELESELSDFEENNQALIRENLDAWDQNRKLQEELYGIAQQYESQAKALQEQQTMLQRYRLAFFGLLALVLATLAILAVRKIVQRISPKNEN